MRTVCLLALAALCPLPALAAITVTSGSASGPVYIGASQCNGGHAIPIEWNLNGRSWDTIQISIIPVTASCSSLLASPGKVVRTVAGSVTTLTPSLSSADLFIAVDDGGVQSCSSIGHNADSPYQVNVCVQGFSNASSGTVGDSGSILVDVATTPPDAPANLTTTPGNQHLRLAWTESTSAVDHYDVHVVPATATPGSSFAYSNVTGLSVDVQQTDDHVGLANGTSYSMTVRATDKYSNVSAASAPWTDSPVYVADFYDHYRDSGGSDTGGRGCASAGSGFLAVIALLAAGLWLRRRRARGAALLLALALPLAARAEDRPPRRWLFAVKADRYSPQIDTQAGLTGTPYHDVFRGRAPLRWQGEIDWQAAHPFGSLLLGVTGGFWQNFGHGLLADGSRSQDTALLDIAPFGLVATYRFDALADRYRWLPIIPYAQAGLSAALWTSRSGTGSVSRATNHTGRGSGWTTGYTTALGVALSLDALDPSFAHEAFVDTGIQRAAIFAEYGWTHLDSFHRAGNLILSDRAWRFGLSLEF